ncbi:ATP-binding cassette domain-containing protein [Ruminococcus sp.]|uniref:ATP-binding cassette domain-containing protein n=1 Tax=Ruminococcus sp. TaxID=41978 RepID=UPI00258F4AD5|nr:ATP-binding cassette domain-containing protein [Ruminococcus sp.]MCR5020849.1 ATP-binding cassette domain-containing protein [Ruminococcus sp.]
MKEQVVEVSDISKKVNNRILFSDFSFGFNREMIYSISGRSGVGKSTLLNILSTLGKPNSGKVELFGMNIATCNSREISLIRNKRIGVVFQNYLLDERLSASENVMIPTLINKDICNVKDRIYTLFNELEIGYLTDRKVLNLSGGEKQRISIARALVNDPDILFMDEPTANLDNKSEEVIIRLLQKLAYDEKKCIVCVTHSEKFLNNSNCIINICNNKITAVNNKREED